MMNTDILITIGSRAFFEGMEGFHPKDTDLLILQAKPSGYRYVKQIHMSGRCIYYWRRLCTAKRSGDAGWKVPRA